MKTVLFILPVVFLFSLNGKSQCTTSVTQIHYDTTVNGYGATGINPFQFQFPQFDPNTGTLLNVHVSSVVSLLYNYDIENMLSARTHAVRINRIDDLMSPALLFPVMSEYTTPWNYHPLGSNDGVAGSGPDFLSVPPFHIRNKDTMINEILPNTADFMGQGQVNFEYSTAMFRTNSGGASISNDSAQDQIRFALTYTYCDNIMLADDIGSFTAQRNGGHITLRWTAAGGAGREELLVSRDGIHFQPVYQAGQEGGTRQFIYPVPDGEGTLYFRVRSSSPSGSFTYSPVRSISLEGSGGDRRLLLFSHPLSGRELHFEVSGAIGKWKAELYTAAGQLLGERSFRGGEPVRWQLPLNLAGGVYFLRSGNVDTGERFTERLIVR